MQAETGEGSLSWIERDGTVHELGSVGGSPGDFDINNRWQAVWWVSAADGLFRSFTCRLER